MSEVMSEVRSLTSKNNEAADLGMTLPAVLVTIDFSRGSQMEPIPRDFVFPGLPAGKVAILSAPGGTGKSFFLLELGMSVAAGEPLIHGLTPNGSGPVKYISFEEDGIDLHNRLVSLFQTFGGLKPPVDRFFPSALEGESLPLLVGRDVGRGVAVNKDAVTWLERQCTGMRMVIL
ncbi:MAG: AAA family ATPase, partial [Clostridia bacterium]|nr:AAA family ATPase [Clostridia bacterium]